MILDPGKKPCYGVISGEKDADKTQILSQKDAFQKRLIFDYGYRYIKRKNTY